MFNVRQIMMKKNLKIIISIFLLSFTATAHAKGLYVINQGGSINVIDIDSEKMTKEIPAGRDSINLLPDPSGRYMVIGNGEEAGKIWVLDRTTEGIVAKIPVMKGRMAGFPYFVFSKDSAKLLVISRYSAELYIIDAREWKIEKTIPLKLTPEGMDISIDGRHLFIINREPPNLLVFNLETEKVERGINLEGTLSAITKAPDGRRLYITDKGSANTLVIDASTFEVIKRIVVGTEPVDLTISRDGRFLYVSCRFSYSIIVIDTVEMKAAANIPVGIHPWGMALNSDETEAYVANYNENTVSIIDLKKRREIYRLPTGAWPTKVIFVP